MDAILFEYFQNMKRLLSHQEQSYGPLKHLSSRNTETSDSIDAVTNTITKFLKDNPRFKMYNIKIFVEDVEVEARHTISISAIGYKLFLMNTNFSSQDFFRKDHSGCLVGTWPTLSPYLFLQIIWHLKCEDLLVESLVHIPLDLCVEILEITIKHINELEVSRARRFIFLLIYKIYYKCLWLHLGTLSEQNVIECIDQLVNYFRILCDLLVSPRFVADISIEKCLRPGILLKNMLYYIRKCMHSKIESYSENHNLAKLFTLTYGYFDEHESYCHMLPANEVKAIVIKFDQQLATLLLKQIIKIDYSEFMAWDNINDDENPTISLQNAIVIECYYFIKFMRQNEFLVANENLFKCLERLTSSRKSEKSLLTVQELCNDIARGKWYGMKELIKRYKEWDLSILDFINERIELLTISDVSVILEYLHYIFGYLRTKAEKYQLYTSVLKILIQLRVTDMDFIVQNYVERHFDDNPLRCLYNEECFVKFMEDTSVDDLMDEMNFLNVTQLYSRILLIFILLHPKEVLKKIVMYEISPEIDTNPILEYKIDAVRSYYTLTKHYYNVLLYILQDIVFQQRIEWCTRFTDFLDNALRFKMISADDIMNQIYIIYLIDCSFNKTTMSSICIILKHMNTLLRQNCTNKTNCVLLTLVLIKTASLLRRLTFLSKITIYYQMVVIVNMMSYLRSLPTFPRNILHFYYKYGIEPLEMDKLFLQIHTLHIIHQYEKRCFVVHQQLRTDPQCHPKLRSYVQSFRLDREDFIRHMILHCFKEEYETHMLYFTFTFLGFGWVNKMTACENLMRITAEASQIAVMYAKMFPNDTFVVCLFSIVHFCWMSMEYNTIDNYKAIRQILLKTLSSMDVIISRTPYGKVYNQLLKRVQHLDPYLSKDKYISEIQSWIHVHMYLGMPQTMSPENNCACNKRSYCQCHSSHIEKKIATMYNAQLFIRECIRLSPMSVHNYSDRLLHNLCLE